MDEQDYRIAKVVLGAFLGLLLLVIVGVGSKWHYRLAAIEAGVPALEARCIISG